MRLDFTQAFVANVRNMFMPMEVKIIVHASLYSEEADQLW